MADVGGAERLAARLLGEVEECGLSEVSIFPSIHTTTNICNRRY